MSGGVGVSGGVGGVRRGGGVRREGGALQLEYTGYNLYYYIAVTLTHLFSMQDCLPCTWILCHNMAQVLMIFSSYIEAILRISL